MSRSKLIVYSITGRFLLERATGARHIPDDNEIKAHLLQSAMVRAEVSAGLASVHSDSFLN